MSNVPKSGFERINVKEKIRKEIVKKRSDSQSRNKKIKNKRSVYRRVICTKGERKEKTRQRIKKK